MFFKGKQASAKSTSELNALDMFPFRMGIISNLRNKMKSMQVGAQSLLLQLLLCHAIRPPLVRMLLHPQTHIPPLAKQPLSTQKNKKEGKEKDYNICITNHLLGLTTYKERRENGLLNFFQLSYLLRCTLDIVSIIIASDGLIVKLPFLSFPFQWFFFSYIIAASLFKEALRRIYMSIKTIANMKMKFLSI